MLRINHPYERTTVTEGYQPNLALCIRRLRPKGIRVVRVLGEEREPFDCESFDIILNRHGSYDPTEIKRLLKPGGIFVTKQVGALNNLPLRVLLNRDSKIGTENIVSETNRFKTLGFEIREDQEAFSKTKCKSIDAIIYRAKVISWEFSEFNVEEAYSHLEFIEDMFGRQGYYESFEHRYYLVAAKLTKSIR